MRVDFHVHSTASDGTVAPAKLAELAQERKFACMSLTDHDNMDGVDECRAACREHGVPFVAGMELSIDPGRGFDRFHLLAIGVDPAAERLLALRRRILAGRNDRNRAILEKFAKIGIDIPAEELDSYAHGEVLARPHFAAWLRDHGHATGIKDAFAKYLLRDSPPETCCYAERWRPSQEEAFGAVHEAGGLCVMAHPKYWRRAWADGCVDYDAARGELFRLKESGLDAMEAKYQSNTAGMDVEFTRIADEVGLLKTAGSDFHGSNKPTIHLGMDVEEAFIAPFLEAIVI